MRLHKMKLTKYFLDKIKSGSKIIETRLFDEKRQKIKLGDNIEFSQNKDATNNVLTKVIGLYRYPSFAEMFADLPIEYLGSESAEELLKEMRQFYSPAKEEKLGVIGIKVKKISNTRF